jgi:hypothetical protein
MAAQRRSNILASLLKLGRKARRSRSLSAGPGCTCEKCVQAWDQHQPQPVVRTRKVRRLGFGD